MSLSKEMTAAEKKALAGLRELEALLKSEKLTARARKRFLSFRELALIKIMRLDAMVGAP